MTFNVLSRSTLTGIGIATAALAPPAIASAQESLPPIGALSDEEVRALPSDLQSGPLAIEETTDTTVGADGIETITRTRRIESAAVDAGLPPLPATTGPATGAISQGYAPAYPQSYYAPGHASGGYAPAAYAPGAQVFQREQWIDECERRTSGRGNREKGGIIGGLLGAIAGGIVGNEVARVGERLGATLIGVGVGGIGGALLGSLIGGGKNDRGEYDCEAALDSYLSQYGQPGTRIAARTIPAPGPVYAAPAYPAYGYAPAYPSYGYTYAPPQQIVYVPIEYQQQRRVIVRETVREEVIPGAARTIPAPAPVPLPAPRPAPRPIKAQPIPIKGN